MRERKTFSAVRQVEQLVSIQLRKASDSLKHAIKLNAVPWLISAVSCQSCTERTANILSWKCIHVTKVRTITRTKGFVAD